MTATDVLTAVDWLLTCTRLDPTTGLSLTLADVIESGGWDAAGPWITDAMREYATTVGGRP